MTDDYDWAADADTWSDSIPDGKYHEMPDEDGIVKCCGRRSEALPYGDWMTAGTDRVTCDRVKVTA